MFGLDLKVIGAAAGAVSIAFGAGYVYARAGVSAEIDAAVEVAKADARQATERAINELSDEADQARMRRHLCRDRGGVWSFANNKCIETETQP